MSCSTPDGTPPNATPAAVLTVSDSCTRGEKEIMSGPAVEEALKRRGFQVMARGLVADDSSTIQKKLIEMCRSARLVVTTGGTGIAPRDVTPEATRAVCERLVEGLAEQMRAEGMRKTRFAALGRGVCGVRGHELDFEFAGQSRGRGRVAGGGGGFVAARAGADCWPRRSMGRTSR